ncbi:MAG: ATP-grasp domain-containing protein [Candidatus Promineofilum sp.]|nr:ATP-grasp domain-containing protein [Promineifilum sp.]
MFKKILIANRGEIAVRIIRTCREMGIRTVALYEISDRDSLHVRLADTCVQLPNHHAFMDPDTILAIAQSQGVDAVHPGYGFLAENPNFVRACEAAGIVFIGPPAEIVEATRNKIGMLEQARAAGFQTVTHSPNSFDEDEFETLAAAAKAIGYPLVLKSCSGGRGRGERLVDSPDHLPETVRRAHGEAKVVYGSSRLFMEKAILPAHQVGVQIVADRFGNLVHLGDREGSIVHNNQKIVEESPVLCLSSEGRAALLETAVRMARLFNYQNVGTVEFLVDAAGEFYFSEIKSRIQIDHTLAEMMTRIDLIREQIRLAAGEALGYSQDDVAFRGWAMMCRVQAEDPARRYMPASGHLRRMRLPSGPEVRVDTYLYCDSEVPSFYDPLIAKATVWAIDRPACVDRLRRALEDFAVIGIPTNLPLLMEIMRTPAFVAGEYATDLLHQPLDTKPATDIAVLRRDLAAAAAVLYTRRHEASIPQTPDRWATGWHRTSRHIQ